MYWHLPLIAAAFSGLAACEMTGMQATSSKSIQTVGFATDSPKDAASGTCWGKTISPAIIETITQEVLIKPAQTNASGLIQQPAVYKKEDIQKIVQPRQETWFETVCPNLLTEDFVASLQRSLALRGSYSGATTGLMDENTRRSIRKFQLGGGFDSGNLTVASARSLGLIAIPRSEN